MPKLKIAFSIGLALTVVFCNYFMISAADEETVRIVVGAAKVLSTRAPSRVVIGNPAIADVTDVTNTEITLIGKTAGATNLVYWDAYGEQSVKVKVLAEDVEAIKARVESLVAHLGFKEVYVKAEEDEAKVLILGRVKTALDKDRIMTALGSLKDKAVDLTVIEEDQTVIEIDVQILEVNKDATDTLGFTWPSSLNLIEMGSAAISGGGTSWGNLWKVANIQRGIGGATGTPFSLKVDMLIKEGKARILSRPRLSCQSGKEAKLVVGGEVPVLSSSVSSGGAVGTTGAAQPGNVEYKEYGIILKILPDIYDISRMHLKLNVEVSDVGEAVSTAYALAYPLTKRTAETELLLNDGETMAIGGLIKQKSEEDLRKFPWLSDVPVLGTFFRQKETKSGGGATKRGDTELFITLTPRIVARDVPKNMEEKKEAPQALSQEELFAKSDIPVNMLNYVKAVQIKILRSIYYPRIAKDAGWQGVVKLALKIASDGKLLEQKVAQSSGYKILDDAAESVALQQSPYPPFPPQIESQEVWVEVPVVYKIE